MNKALRRSTVRKAALASVVAATTVAAWALSSAPVTAMPSPAEGAVHEARAAKTVTFSGTLPASAKTFKVMFLADTGQSKIATPDSTGKFSLKIPTSMAAGGSLHLVSPQGRYAGPIVLDVDSIAKKGSETKYFAHLNLAGTGVDLGKLTVNPSGPVTYAKASGVAATAFLRTAVRAAKSGAPVGAGFAGLVAKPKVITSSELALLAGKKSKSVRAGNQQGGNQQDQQKAKPGEDQDGDGLPNALDVDDNGNKSLDIADPNSGATRGLSTWSDLRISQSTPFNADITGTVTSDSIASYIGTYGTFSTVFFIDQLNLAASSLANAVDYVYVNCGALEYCGGSSPSAKIDARSDSSQDPVNWNAFSGGHYPEGTTIPAGATSAVAPAGNALEAMYRLEDHGDGTGSHIFTSWTGFMNPGTGAQTLSKVHVGDVYDLTYRIHGESADQHRAMTLSPFAVTVPGLVSMSPAMPAPSTDTWTLGSDGKVTMTFTRPQRFVVDGETGQYRDLGGLNYGLILGSRSGGNEFGCAPSFYSNLRGVAVRSGLSGSNQSDFLWPLVDSTATDLVPSSSNTVSFTLDVKGCLVSNGISSPEGNNYMANLTAAGQSVTGGANRATLSMNVNVPE